MVREAGCRCTWRLCAGRPYLFDFASAKIIYHLPLFHVFPLFFCKKREKQGKLGEDREKHREKCLRIRFWWLVWRAGDCLLFVFWLNKAYRFSFLLCWLFGLRLGQRHTIYHFAFSSPRLIFHFWNNKDFFKVLQPLEELTHRVRKVLKLY